MYVGSRVTVVVTRKILIKEIPFVRVLLKRYRRRQQQNRIHVADTVGEVIHEAIEVALWGVTTRIKTESEVKVFVKTLGTVNVNCA